MTLTAAVPEEADAMLLDLYSRLPEIRIIDLLLEVDDGIGINEAFTHLRMGASCKDLIGVLTVLLAEEPNLGLRKMAEVTNTHDSLNLLRLSRWHVESEARSANPSSAEIGQYLAQRGHYSCGRNAYSSVLASLSARMCLSPV